MSSWEYVFLNELLSESKIIDDNPDPNRKIRVRLNCNGVEKRPLMSEKKGATKNYIRKSGQFIYGKQNFHKGAFGVIPTELDGFSSSGDLPAFDVDSRCLPEWIYYWFKTDNRYLQLAKHAKGVGSQRVNVKSFLQEKIALPSLKQQSQIIDKINKRKLTAESFKTEQTTQATLLSQLRQAILQEAIEGKLTADWRKENPVRKGDPDYDAEALLQKIQAEKEKLIKEGKIKKQKTLAPIKAEEVPFELPVGWVWTRLGEVCHIEKGSLGITKAIPGEYPLVALSEERLSHNEYQFNCSAVIIPLISSTGHGHASMKRIHYQEGKFSVGNILCCVYPKFDSVLNMKFLYIYLDMFKEKFFVKKMKGAANVSLNISAISETPIPLIPIHIQNNYEKIVKIIDELEKQVSERKEQSEQLMQAVLREAFERGK